MIKLALLLLSLIMPTFVACKTAPETPRLLPITVTPTAFFGTATAPAPPGTPLSPQVVTPTAAGGTAPVSSPTVGAANRAWHVKLALSGGFAGLDRVLDLSSDGSIVVVDRRTGRQVTRRLPEQDLAEIASLVTSAQPAPAANRMPACADCFQYGLDVQRDGQGFSAQMNDVSLADSGLEPLVRALTRLMDRSFSGP